MRLATTLYHSKTRMAAPGSFSRWFGKNYLRYLLFFLGGLLLDAVGLPILSGTEQPMPNLRVREGRDLGHEIQVVLRVPTLDADARSGRCDDIPVEINVPLSGLDSLEQN